MIKGSKVRYTHPYDGTKRAGAPIGPTHVITHILNHKPIDGPEKKDCIAALNNGRWEFIWSLHLVK